LTEERGSVFPGRIEDAQVKPSIKLETTYNFVFATILPRFGEKILYPTSALTSNVPVFIFTD
jgi:hypothetical protein